MVNEVPVKDGRIFFELKEDELNVPRESIIANLESIIHEIDCELISSRSHELLKQEVITDLHAECNRHGMDYSAINPFGSAFNGFWSSSSDIDVVIDLCQNGAKFQFEAFESFLKNSPRLFRLKLTIRNATVPIITVEHIKTMLRCDISFSAPAISRSDVIWNTKLLKSYTDLYPEISRSFRFIKLVLNQSTYGSTRTQGLSTYSHIIMYIYFLSHCGKRYIPHIHPTTFQPSTEQTPRTISPAEMILDYLEFISCKLDSSKLKISVSSPDIIPRPPNYGQMGRLGIADPYVNKNLGTYMKGEQLYDFKLYCYRLLQFIRSGLPSRIHHITKWCKEYQNTAPFLEDPPISPDCSELLCTHIFPETDYY